MLARDGYMYPNQPRASRLALWLTDGRHRPELADRGHPTHPQRLSGDHRSKPRGEQRLNRRELPVLRQLHDPLVDGYRIDGCHREVSPLIWYGGGCRPRLLTAANYSLNNENDTTSFSLLRIVSQVR